MQELFSIITKLGSHAPPGVDFRRSLVLAAWRRVAGDELNQRAAISDFTDGVLTIATASPTWQNQLRELAPQLLYRVNALIGGSGVDRIEFIVDEAAVSDALSPDDQMIEDAEPAPEIVQAAAAIKDDDLRAAFLAAAANSLALKEKRYFDKR